MRLVMKHHELIFAKGKLSIATTRVVAKLHFEYARRQRFDDCADVAPAQSFVSQIGDERNNV
jgi:hypothetical protein